MMSFNLFLPEFNEFITDLGGEESKGMIFLMFSISAAISRPFSGKLADTIGRKKVMYIGIVLGFLTTLAYPLSEVVIFFLWLRFIHGFSAGFLPTGATALVTDILPTKGRGVAMGIWGTFISVGFGVGNFFATYIEKAIGLTGLILVAAGFALVAGLLISFIRETLPNPQKFQWKFLKVGVNDVFEPTVRPAAFVMFCSATSTGIMFVTSPDMSGYVGIENKGWFFLFYMSSTIVIRLFASSLSDKIGRRKALLIGLSFMAISMLTLGFSENWVQYTVGAIIFGISTGISSPTIFAWMADLSPEKRRGVGSGTVFIALEMAIIFGAVITLLLYDSTPLTIPLCYILGATFALIGIGYLLWHLRRRESIT
ncbi:MAG: MFS transporter [Crocinitomicaceae bacterium]